MADTYEKDLAQKSSLTVNDFIRVVGTDNVSYKQLVSDVAKKIIENYTGSSLAGSSRSVKSALDSLNSKCAERVSSPAVQVSNIDTAMTTGFYRYSSSSTGNKPVDGGGVLIVIRFNDTYAQQLAIPYATNGSNGVFKRVISSGTASAWVNIV